MSDNQTNNQDTGDHEIKNNLNQYRILGNPLQSCQHCYCGESNVNGKAHVVCCMCGHRILKNQISYLEKE